LAVPFVDLKAEYRSIAPEIRAALERVLDDAAYILGPSVATFESAFAKLCGSKHCIAMNSGTSALHLAALALGVGPGDEVIVPAMTFVATAAAVEYCGARPVLVDVEPKGYGLDPARIAPAITARTKAIVPVHLYGRPAEMDAIMAIADKHGLPVIEDAAQAHGANYRGRMAGSIGRIGCFSFYPSKNLGAFGEGGAAVTDDDELAATMRSLRDWGQEGRYNHLRKGFNYRMDGLQGAVLGVKLAHLSAWTEGRRRAARAYEAALAGLDLTLPEAGNERDHVFHVYPVLVAERDRVQRALAASGVQTGIHYPTPVHLLPSHRDLGYGAGAFPVAERIGLEELSLPMFPGLSEAQIGEVAAALRRALA
jgi:dTDP-4-amino-4,6-dideoxygalactose transaminase